MTWRTDPDNPQIYWLGPVLGSLLASGFYRLMKMLEYETANPGQDSNEHEFGHSDPEKEDTQPVPVLNSQQNDALSHENISYGTEATDYDPNGVSASPGSPNAFQGRRRGLSILNGARKDLDYSPGRAAQKPTQDIWNTYEGGPNAESGHVSKFSGRA